LLLSDTLLLPPLSIRTANGIFLFTCQIRSAKRRKSSKSLSHSVSWSRESSVAVIHFLTLHGWFWRSWFTGLDLLDNNTLVAKTCDQIHLIRERRLFNWGDRCLIIFVLQ
jgi:hypothetical protein